MSRTKGVYKTPSGRWTPVIWSSPEGKLRYFGTYNTEEEASLVRRHKMQGHHWSGVTPDPEGSYGFVYSGVNLSRETIYFGRKAYTYYNKATDKRDILSNWEFYTGSSKTVDECIDNGDNFVWTILANTKSNDESSVVEWSLINSYLLRKLPSGKPMCLNRVLPKLYYNGLEVAKGSTTHAIQRLLKELP